MTKRKMIIGLKKFVYATLTTDDTTGAEYGAIKPIPGLTEASITPNVNTTIHYSDDKASYTDSKLSSVDFEMSIDDVPATDQATMLGHTIDANGVLIKSANDQAPYVAVGFISPLSDGGERYTWLYKGRFQLGTDSRATQGESKEVQPKSLSATFIPRDFDEQWSVEVNTTDTGVSEAALTAFFTAVYEKSDTPVA